MIDWTDWAFGTVIWCWLFCCAVCGIVTDSFRAAWSCFLKFEARIYRRRMLLIGLTEVCLFTCLVCFHRIDAGIGGGIILGLLHWIDSRGGGPDGPAPLTTAKPTPPSLALPGAPHV
jgi:hypothetical protein